MSYSFVIAGGGTGGHIFPALAVAQVLKQRGHRQLFIGTREGMEARLVPDAGYEMEFIRIGGLNRAGFRKQVQTAMQLPLSVVSARRILGRFRPAAVFSMGGYVAGPVMIAAVLMGMPLIVMEPNAIPGLANRRIAGRVYRALLGFDSTRKWFPAARSEVTGLPVRNEFFSVNPKNGGPFTVLVTGGSRGARTLNKAARESWTFFRNAEMPVHMIHQTGTAEYESISEQFQSAGVRGQVVSFIRNMAETFAQADVVIARAGAGSVNEIAAAGMASILVPLPFAADDHQRKNAEALVEKGAARMVLDSEMSGETLFREVKRCMEKKDELNAMRIQVKQFARPGAAERAAEVLEEAAEFRSPRREAVS